MIVKIKKNLDMRIEIRVLNNFSRLYVSSVEVNKNTVKVGLSNDFKHCQIFIKYCSKTE